MKKIEIFDSTLRDGGYMNNWVFSTEKVQSIYNSADEAGISYVEVGYLDMVIPSAIVKKNAKLFVMVDYKKKDTYTLDENIDGIRIAFHKDERDEALGYAVSLKQLGYLVALQIMAIDNYPDEELIDLSKRIIGVDIVTFADSNGSLIPSRVKELIDVFKGHKYKVNFHAHNNLQLALINSLTAIENGVDIIDCTFNGIGRGAGNLPTELLMSYLNKYYGYSFNLSPVLYAIEKIILPLKGGYNWGYNIENMFSGINGVHPYYGRDASKYNLVNVHKIVEDIGVEKPMKYSGKKKVICLIPARFNSTRFAGKPLKEISGIPMLKRVYDNAMQSDCFDEVFVVTDSNSIGNFCIDNKMNYKWQLTEKCRCGTDAIAEITDSIPADYYVNLQGDEPLIMPETIKQFVETILSYGELDRVAFNCVSECDKEDVDNPNIPKIVSNVYGDLLYMSRYPIPYQKSGYEPTYFKELGLHAYTKKGLDYFYLSEMGELEKTENLEFLRFLEHGKQVRNIRVALPFKNHAVDVPADIQIVEEILKKYG